MKDVRQDAWEDVAAPEAIGSSGMGPCIAAAVLNHTQERAWVAHGSGWSNTEREFGAMMREAQSALNGGDRITLWFVGACVETDIGCDDHWPECELGEGVKDEEADSEELGSGERDLVLADREFVVKEARRRFPLAEVESHFSDDPAVACMNVRFDFAHGEWKGSVERVRWS